MTISERPITPAQVRSIHVALARQGIADEDYRAVLQARFGATTCKALSRRQASELLALFGRPLPRPPATAPKRAPARQRPAPAPDGVAALPTPAQRALIAELADRVEWRQPDGLKRWSRAHFGWPRPTSPEDAARVIEGLKQLCRRAGRWAE